MAVQDPQAHIEALQAIAAMEGELTDKMLARAKIAGDALRILKQTAEQYEEIKTKIMAVEEVKGLTQKEVNKRQAAAMAELDSFREMYNSRRTIINDTLKFEESKRAELLKGYEAHYSKADEMARKSSLNTTEQNKLSLNQN